MAMVLKQSCTSAPHLEGTMTANPVAPSTHTRIRASGGLSAGLLLLRVAVGCVLLEHGLPKLAHPSAFIDTVGRLGVPLHHVAGWLEILGELGLGCLVLVGLLTRVAGVLVAIMMGLVWGVVHLPHGWSPSGGFGGETALLLAVLGLVLALTGAGAWSLDGVLASRRRSAGDGDSR
jgi:putative oxidoreductase